MYLKETLDIKLEFEKEKQGMKTSEFIKKVEELGYEVVNNDSCTEIYRNSCIVAEVLELVVNALNTNYYESVSDVLFNVLVEYARTPIEEREEEKKYYIRPKGMDMGNNYSMVYWTEDEIWGEKSKVNQIEDYQSTFTLKELEDLGINTEHYDLEEVE